MGEERHKPASPERLSPLHPLQTLSPNTLFSHTTATSLRKQPLTQTGGRNRLQTQGKRLAVSHRRRNLVCFHPLQQQGINQGQCRFFRQNYPLLFPLQGWIQCRPWRPDKPVHKRDESAPFAKVGTKRNHDNPPQEETHAAIKALIKY